MPMKRLERSPAQRLNGTVSPLEISVGIRSASKETEDVANLKVLILCSYCTHTVLTLYSH
jgi:hypothetical protein